MFVSFQAEFARELKLHLVLEHIQQNLNIHDTNNFPQSTLHRHSSTNRRKNLARLTKNM